MSGSIVVVVVVVSGGSSGGGGGGGSGGSSASAAVPSPTFSATCAASIDNAAIPASHPFPQWPAWWECQIIDEQQ